jgi:hypothetical protein
MSLSRTILIASAIVALSFPVAAALATTARSGAAQADSDEISAAQRHDDHRRKVQRRPTSVQTVRPNFHRGFADPSIAPNGRPYPVPENLRGQCYIDEGYGRFSACSFRN